MSEQPKMTRGGCLILIMMIFTLVVTVRAFRERPEYVCYQAMQKSINENFNNPYVKK